MSQFVDDGFFDDGFIDPPVESDGSAAPDVIRFAGDTVTNFELEGETTTTIDFEGEY